jgi:hypothetical protein
MAYVVLGPGSKSLYILLKFKSIFFRLKKHTVKNTVKFSCCPHFHTVAGRFLGLSLVTLASAGCCAHSPDFSGE